MSGKDIEELAMRLAPMVADQVVAKLGLTPAPSVPAVAPVLRQRLTVEQFAFIVERSVEVVRRKIRSQRIPKEWVHGPPYHLHPKALTKFAVTPEIATERLAEWYRLHPEQAETPAADRPPSPV